VTRLIARHADLEAVFDTVVSEVARVLDASAGLFDSPVYDRKLAAAAKLVGRNREVAYGKLDVELARKGAPLVAFTYQTHQDFFSARMGCHVYHPAYGMDLAALCLRRSS
jgi:hypothetical protein